MADSYEEWQKYLALKEEQRRLIVGAVLSEKSTDEEIKKEEKRAKMLIEQMTGISVSEIDDWEELFEILNKVDSEYIEAARIATMWWVKKLTNPNKAEFYVAKPTQSLPFGPEGLSKEKEPLFRTYLMLRILMAMESYYCDHSCCVDVDYNPCGILYDAGRLAGLRPKDYPHKTGTTITSNNEVYAAGELIYSKYGKTNSTKKK